MNITSRHWAIVTALFTFGLFIAGYLLEYVYYYSPCILCYIQRYLFLLITILLLPAVLGLKARGLKSFIFALGITAAVAGITLSINHLQIQAMPPELAPNCSMETHKILESNNILRVFEAWLHKDAECTVVQTFLGVNLVHWSLVGFLLTTAMLLQGLKISLIRKR